MALVKLPRIPHRGMNDTTELWINPESVSYFCPAAGDEDTITTVQLLSRQTYVLRLPAADVANQLGPARYARLDRTERPGIRATTSVWVNLSMVESVTPSFENTASGPVARVLIDLGGQGCVISHLPLTDVVAQLEGGA